MYVCERERYRSMYVCERERDRSMTSIWCSHLLADLTFIHLELAHPTQVSQRDEHMCTLVWWVLYE